MSKMKKLLKDLKDVEKLSAGDSTVFDDVEDLSLIKLSNYRETDTIHVDSLIESIRTSGVLQAVQVKVVIEKTGVRSLQCINGHHRIKAVKSLRDEAIATGESWHYRPLPIIVEVVNEEQSSIAKDVSRAVASNSIIKKDNIYDRAAGIKKLKDEGVLGTKIASLLGVDRKTVERAVLVSSIPDECLVEMKKIKLSDSQVYKIASSIKRITDVAGYSFNEALEVIQRKGVEKAVPVEIVPPPEPTKVSKNKVIPVKSKTWSVVKINEIILELEAELGFPKKWSKVLLERLSPESEVQIVYQEAK